MYKLFQGIHAPHRAGRGRHRGAHGGERHGHGPEGRGDLFHEGHNFGWTRTAKSVWIMKKTNDKICTLFMIIDEKTSKKNVIIFLYFVVYYIFMTI